MRHDATQAKNVATVMKATRIVSQMSNLGFQGKLALEEQPTIVPSKRAYDEETPS
jgi:hypothetical protein